jgi:acetyl/propionyl-CoA carboxylase alpha subunit
MFRKVLIANRGEIAIRITRCLQELGVTSAVVYSDADRSAPHVRAADEAYHLPGVASADTYLNGSAIIALARAHGVQAIHPGYGFLSENSGFAQACAGAGLTFIGPSPEVIRAMGDKIVARATLADAGVPVVPGWHGPDDAVDEAELAQQADRIGYPVMLKAAAGGGGKGMRIVRGRAELANRWPRPGGKRKVRLATRASSSKNTWSAPVMWNSKSSATRAATWSTSSSGNAPSSAGIRRSSRNRPHRDCLPSCVRRWPHPPSGRRGR